MAAARTLNEIATRERLVETGRAFRERLAYLETIPLKHRLKLLLGILIKDGLSMLLL